MNGRHPYFKKYTMYSETFNSTTTSGTNSLATINVKCRKCGKFDPTYPIFSSGMTPLPTCTCNEETKKEVTMGWECPVCGRGNAPHNMVCDCVSK